MLQKGFAEARERLSVSFADTDDSDEQHVRFHAHRDLLHAIRARLPSMGSSQHSDGSNEPRGRFLHKRNSRDSDSSDENRGTASRKESFSRHPSELSSACSFGSVGGDDLPMILSEENEEDDTNKSLAGHKDDFIDKHEKNEDQKSFPGEAEEKAPSKKNKKGKKRQKWSKDSGCVIQ